MRTSKAWESLSIEDKKETIKYVKDLDSLFFASTKNKWFDYRPISSAEATYIFADWFSEIYREYYARIVDYNKAQTLKILPDDIFDSLKFTTIVHARVEADRLNCKYEFYIRNAFDLWLARGYKRLPDIHEIYSESLTADIARLWWVRCDAVLQLAEHEFYFDDHWVGHPDQVAYHDYLIKIISQRENKHIVMAELIRKGHLPQDIALGAFGDITCRRALMY